MTRNTLRGRLVVATPALADPNFSHAVVFVIEHGGEGALGVVLNRPSTATIASALPEWDELAAAPPVVFVGGPVQPSAVIGLVSADAGSPDVQHIADGVGVLDLSTDPSERAAALRAVRVFAGYAGWGPGQLEQEVEVGGWFIVDGAPDDVFTSQPDRLWRAVLTRQGGLLRTIPEDPSLN